MNIRNFINDLRRRRELLDEAILAAERLASEGRRGRPPGKGRARRHPPEAPRKSPAARPLAG